MICDPFTDALATCLSLGLNIFTFDFVVAKMFSFLVDLKKHTVLWILVYPSFRLYSQLI